jgi:hydrogenase expression/formation protein HypE
MRENEKNILLGHGSGGSLMHRLIGDVFLKHFGNSILNDQTDSAILTTGSEEIAFTTDSFVIDPVFFPGGNIGKLAVCGTVNDLAVCGAHPKYISVSFIIEEGFPVSELEEIVISLAAEAKNAGVLVVTGDTKVVHKGKCDKIFINTAGIGIIDKRNKHICRAENVMPGDLIIINGNIGDHGMAVLNSRESFNFKVPLVSDCASLNTMISDIIENHSIRFMRDPTRGGVATVLNELAQKTGLGIEISESDLPVRSGVKALCELLGFDPLHSANEGKVIIVAPEHEGSLIVDRMRKSEHGGESAIIGKVVAAHPGRVILKNDTGGSRIIDTIMGDQLPRIC